MRLAKIVGTVVATVKEPGLATLSLLVCLPCDAYGTERPETEPFVAADAVGVGVGEVVLVATGSAARVGARTSSAPADATVVGVVDAIQLGRQTTYRKGG